MHYFHPVLEHGLPPSLNLTHNAYSIFPRIYVRRESMARGTWEHFTFPELSEWTLHLYSSLEFSDTQFNPLPPRGGGHFHGKVIGMLVAFFSV